MGVDDKNKRAIAANHEYFEKCDQHVTISLLVKQYYVTAKL